MKQLLVLIVTFIMASYSFAATNSNNDSVSLKDLSLAWKNQQYMHAKEDKNDITIVYGGADVSRKSPFFQHTTTV